MATLKWTDQDSVNIQEIDTQHQRVINLAAALDDAMRQGKGRDVLDKTMKELIRYTQSHFAAEERFTAANSYPDYEDHKTRLQKMAKKVVDLHPQCQEGRKTMTIDVMNFLQDFFHKHIMGTDKKYAPLSQRQGLPPKHAPSRGLEHGQVTIDLVGCDLDPVHLPLNLLVLDEFVKDVISHRVLYQLAFLTFDDRFIQASGKGGDAP